MILFNDDAILCLDQIMVGSFDSCIHTFFNCYMVQLKIHSNNLLFNVYDLFSLITLSKSINI